MIWLVRISLQKINNPHLTKWKWKYLIGHRFHFYNIIALDDRSKNDNTRINECKKFKISEMLRKNVAFVYSKDVKRHYGSEDGVWKIGVPETKRLRVRGYGHRYDAIDTGDFRREKLMSLQRCALGYCIRIFTETCTPFQYDFHFGGGGYSPPWHVLITVTVRIVFGKYISDMNDSCQYIIEMNCVILVFRTYYVFI